MASEPRRESQVVLDQSIIDTLAATARYYNAHAATYADQTLSANVSSLYSRFLPRLPPGARILDVGCGSGRDLRAFAEMGYRPVGIDSSSELARIAVSYSGAPCAVVRVEEMMYSNSFEGIWACASLLHIPKSILPEALSRIKRALVPRGILFASIQEGDGEHVAPDGRYYAYYQMQEFVRYVSEADFVVEDAWRSEDVLGRQSQPKWLNVLARADC